MPKISVILPVKNGERYVRSAIVSTLRALPRDAELVVLNDGSTDMTQDVLESILDIRMRILTSSGCGGLSNALNFLIESTDSEFVARMDADDISLPWRFRHQSGLLDDSDLVFSPVIHLGPRPYTLVPTRPGPFDSEIVPLMLALENPIAHSTAIFRRKSVESVGGYRSVRSEDYDLWLRLACEKYQIRRSQLPVLIYRHHGEQITVNSKWVAESRVEPLLLESHTELVNAHIGRFGDTLSGLRDPKASNDALQRSLDMVDTIDRGIHESTRVAGNAHLARRIREVRRALRRRLEPA
ncbi:glycosyltransferase family 2 protein [Rhodococcus sp. SJ-3]|uniref:glycosyltransferase family 2 protein n=1 Tax=Rhodococcus sp. SJ-3 TaxID=3454628 RepID=UPI003F7AE32D